MAGRLPSPDVLCAYLEPLVGGARAIVVGDATSGVTEKLLDLGARAVHVYDPDEARAAKATPPRGVFLQVLPEHDFDVRDGAFDIALVPDIAALPDSVATLARLRRILSNDGAILVCASNPDATGEGISYYELYDRVALQFASVRMIGVVAFAGTTLAELGLEDEEPDVSVDTQLITEPDAPFAFCALASQNEDVRLSPYAIVQHRVEAPAQVVPVAEIPPPLDTSPRTGELEAALAETSERLEEALRQTAHLDAQLAESKVRIAAAEERALAAEKRAQENESGEEIAALEARLKERAKAIADLEREVRRREKIAKELVMTLEQQTPEETLRAKLDALAVELARRHGELEASKWRVAELEQKLAQPQPAPEKTSDLAHEVDVLRQALAQEHEARVRAESGEELAHARAELQKQAVLLSQTHKTEG